MDPVVSVQTKTSQETQKNLMKFLEPSRKPKVIYTDNSLEFGKSCEELSWNHCTSTPHRSETNGISERAVRRVKEGTSAVLPQSGLGKECVNGIHPAPDIHEHFTIHKGYGTLRTSSRTTSTTLSAL